MIEWLLLVLFFEFFFVIPRVMCVMQSPVEQVNRQKLFGWWRVILNTCINFGDITRPSPIPLEWATGKTIITAELQLSESFHLANFGFGSRFVQIKEWFWSRMLLAYYSHFIYRLKKKIFIWILNTIFFWGHNCFIPWKQRKTFKLNLIRLLWKILYRYYVFFFGKSFFH